MASTTERHYKCEKRTLTHLQTTQSDTSFATKCGIHNFRDIGRCQSAGSIGVRKGYIFRSANLNEITSLGANVLAKDFAIQVVFDLRSGEESSTTNNAFGNGIEVRHLPAMNWKRCEEPLVKHFTWLSHDITAAFLVIYERLCLECAPAYRVIFNHIKDHPKCPILVHCDIGKDRTGLLVSLILKVLDVSNDDIEEEYHRSEIEIVPLIASKSRKLLENPVIANHSTDIGNHFLAPREAMRALLLHVEEVYGGGEGYLSFLGFTDADIKSIKGNLSESKMC